MNKIVFIIGQMLFPSNNACAQRELVLGKMFARCSFQPILIGYSNSHKFQENNPQHIEECIIYTRPYPSSIMSWFRDITDISFIKKIINKYEGEKYIVLVDYFVFATKKILKFAKKKDIKVIFSAEEWYEKVQGFPRGLIKNFDTDYRMKHIYHHATNMICISKYLYNYYKTSVKNIIEIPAIVDKTDSKWYLREIFNNEDNTVRFIYAGHPGKGKDKERLDIFIKAFIAFTRKRENFQLEILGISENQIGEYIGRERKNIIFSGIVSHEECLSRLKMSNFSVIPRERSRKNNAGFPTKLSESLACGTPVITNRISNVDEYITNYENGFIVDECTEDGFIKVFEKIAKLTKSQLMEMKNKAKNDNRLTSFNFLGILKNFLDKI